MSVFNEYSTIYNLLYRDKDYRSETDFVHRILQKNNIKTVLEYGSGTGIHGCLLVDKGYSVTGVELSKGMFEQAKQRITEQKKERNFSIYNGDIRTFTVDSKFDAVISLFHVISYLTENDDVIKTFVNAATHLKQGGMFLFDVWYLPAVLTLHPQNKIKKAESEEYLLHRITEPVILFNSNIVEVNFKSFITDKRTANSSMIEEKHFMRYFSTPEIHLFASIAGFEVIESKEFLTSNTPSENTWGVYFILRKK
jgi:SAM-dependent methyltransferase